MHFNVSVAPSKCTRMYKVYTFYTDVDAARSGYSDTEQIEHEGLPRHVH